MRASFPWLELHALEPIEGYLWLLPVVFILGPGMLALQGFYAPTRSGPRRSRWLIIFRSCTVTVVALILFLFFLRLQLARSVVVMVGLLGGTLVYLRDAAVRWADARDFVQAQLRRRALWVGVPTQNDRLRSALTPDETAAMESVGEFDPASQTIGHFVGLLHQHAVNIVILNLAGIGPERTRALLDACGREGIEVLIRPGLGPLAAPRLALDHFGGEAVFYYHAQGPNRGQVALKQVFDYTAAAALLILLSPFLVLVATVIRLTSPGPILYRQLRSGLNGSTFVLLKFRSMTVDADARKSDLESQNEMRGPVFKMSADPRVTPIGKMLRRHSIDELPQLWNILRGEMSLVGPRPLPVEEVRRFDDNTHRRRLSVKPGLTCLWQTQGRNDIPDFADWVRLDLEYIDRWSLWLDCKILLATIPVAFLGRGAR